MKSIEIVKLKNWHYITLQLSLYNFKIQMKKAFLFSFIWLTLFNLQCKTVTSSADKTFDFSKLNRVILFKVNNFKKLSESGSVVQNEIAGYLISHKIIILSRDQKVSYLSELEFLQSTGEKDNIETVAILECTISNYKIEQDILSPFEERTYGTNTTTRIRKINPVKERDVKTGKEKIENHIITEKVIRTHDAGKLIKKEIPKHINAKVALNIRITQLKTNRVLFTSKSSSEGVHINIATENAVRDALAPLVKLK